MQLLASGALELDLGDIDVSAPLRTPGSANSDQQLFRMDDLQGNMFLQRALEEAVRLGTTAREQKWSSRKVSQQFEVLMALSMPLKHLEAYGEAKRLREAKVVKSLREARAERKLLQKGTKEP